MRKFVLSSEQEKMSLSADAYVEEAASKASWLVRREVRGPGDLLPAMSRIEQRYGVPYSVLWALRYRRPKDILVSVYARISAAYDAEVERQRKLLEHEAAISKARTGIGALMDRAADALVSAKDEAVKP